ncbi:MAG: hypothetical protein P1U58_14435 [Verrucomicrobiales bacterium]|nr:hypothetical protein [Verrucomicrobiales bacterium]
MNENSTQELTSPNSTTDKWETEQIPKSVNQDFGKDESALKETADTLRKEGSAIVHTAKESAARRADQYTEELSFRIRSVENATRGAADQLRSDEPEFVTHAFDWISDQTQKVAEYIEERDSKELLTEAKGLIRRKPAGVLGGIAAVGFLTARFLKASDGERQQ